MYGDMGVQYQKYMYVSLNFILFVQITHIHTNTFHGHTLFIQKGFRRKS